jgi:hypothetical protein
MIEAGNSGEIRVTMPGTGIIITYASQCERDRSERFARARQQIAGRAGLAPSWEALTSAEHEDAMLEARNWLRAGVAAGLVAPCPVHAGGGSEG